MNFAYVLRDDFVAYKKEIRNEMDSLVKEFSQELAVRDNHINELREYIEVALEDANARIEELTSKVGGLEVMLMGNKHA